MTKIAFGSLGIFCFDMLVGKAFQSSSQEFHVYHWWSEMSGFDSCAPILDIPVKFETFRVIMNILKLFYC